MNDLISKLNPTCKKALDFAIVLSSSQNNYNVELEHFLLKLFESSHSDAQVILKHYDIDLKKVINHLESAVHNLECDSHSSPLFSKNLTAVLENAWSISSLTLMQNFINSFSILLAIINIDSLREVILEICPLLLKIPRFSFRSDVYDLLKLSREEDVSFLNKPDLLDQKKEENRSFLSQYTINMVQKAKDSLLDPVFGRDQEIRQIIDILCRRRQNNPLLVGESGVGKTAIVEGFVQRIFKKNVPFALRNIEVYALDMGMFLAGTNFQGELEYRLKKLIYEISHHPVPVILFIDEAHTIMGKTVGDLSNLLKPALARGEIRIIAATTWSEYKRFFEKDAAFTRRFEKIRIQEPSLQKSLDMLRISVDRLQNHHHVVILNEALHAAIYLSSRFLPEKRLPDKAICILDTACAQVSLSQCAFPNEIQDLISEKQVLEVEQKTLIEEYNLGYERELHKQRFEQIQKRLDEIFIIYQKLSQEWQRQNRIMNKIQDLRRKISERDSTDKNTENYKKEIQKLYQSMGDKKFVQCEVDRQSVAQVISEWTSIPLSTILSQSHGWTEKNLIEMMNQYIIGQDYALKRISQTIIQYQMGLNNKQKPIGVFFLVGPSGVGKTETAHALVNVLMGHSRHLISLNMNEFQEAHTIATLKGAPPGYLGYGRGGTLTEAVRQNPYSVILMDEIDNAHPDVLNLFYHIFDRGILEDSEGIEVDFSNTFFILTSTDCAKTISEKCVSIKQTEDGEMIFNSLSHRVIKELNENYGASFISRTIVIPYLSLKSEEILSVVKMKLEAIEKNLIFSHQCTLSDLGLDCESIINDFIDNKNNARAVDHYMSHYILPKITNLLQLRYEQAA